MEVSHDFLGIEKWNEYIQEFWEVVLTKINFKTRNYNTKSHYNGV